MVPGQAARNHCRPGRPTVSVTRREKALPSAPTTLLGRPDRDLCWNRVTDCYP
jgi:hypothetical protein